MNLDRAQIFKVATIAIAIIVAIFAILLFSGKIGGISSAKNQNTSSIVVWGTVDEAYFRGAMDAVGQQTGKPLNILYTKVNGDLYSSIIKAREAGAAPDAVFADHEVLNNISDLLTFIPYTYYSQAEYTNNFILGTHQFATPYGAIFLPALVDPLITIYNKSVLTQSNVARPPKTWAELPKFQEALTRYNTDGSLKVSAFGLGTYSTVQNARDILIANMIQLSHKPRSVFWSTNFDGTVKKTFNVDVGTAQNNNSDSDLLSILKFQTSFSDPQKTSYTWSEVGESDYTKFINERLAIYFGYASQIPGIKNKNQNISVGFSYLPQMENDKIITTGKIYGFALANPNSDLSYVIPILRTLTEQRFTSILAASLNMSSARVDTLAGGDGGEYSVIVGNSALVTDVFFDTDSRTSQSLVYRLYDNILSGRKNIIDSIDTFAREWTAAYGDNLNN